MVLRSAPFRPLILAAGLAALAPLPLAALTADELWAASTGVWARMGATVTADVTREGAVVTLRGITGTYDLPQGAGRITAATGDIVLTEGPEGAVSVALAPGFAVDLALTLAEDGRDLPLAISLAVDAPGLTVTATGGADDIRIETAAPQLDLTMDLPGLALPDAAVFLYAGMTDVTQVSRILAHDGLVTLAQTGRAARLVTDLQFADLGLRTVSVARTDDLLWQGEVALPGVVPDLMNIAPALRAGLFVGSSVTTGALLSETVTRIDDTIQSRDRTTSAGSSQSLSLSAGGLHMAGDARATEMELDLADLGLPPLRLPLGGLAFDVTLPLLVLDAPQEGRFVLEMTGIDPGPLLDALVAPGTAALSTAPGAVVVNLAAQVTPRQDLTDLLALGATLDRGGVVAEVNGVTLNQAQLDWAGASGLVSGWLNLNWAGVNRLDALPQPEGAGTLRITGANDLLARLSQAGVLPPEVLLGARGALAMAGRAVGDDAIEGAFDVSPEGGFRLNGARLD